MDAEVHRWARARRNRSTPLGPPTSSVVDVRGGSRSGVREGDAARSVDEWRVKRELGCVPLWRAIGSVLMGTVSVPWQADQGGSLNFEPCTGRTHTVICA